jgi:hypothetical protein
MQKHKLRFLFFITILLASKSIIAMEEEGYQRPHQGRFGNHHDDEIGFDNNHDNNVIECPICMDDTNQFTRLHCGHEYCNECLRNLLNTAFSQNQVEQARCPNPDCQENLTEEDFEDMQHFAGQEIRKVQQKIADNARPVQIQRADWRTQLRLHFVGTPCPDCGVRVIRGEGCAHMKCHNQQCNQHFCYICGGVWDYNGRNGYQYHGPCKLIGPLKTGVKIGAATAVAGYGLYKLGKAMNSAKNSFFKKHPNLEQAIKTRVNKVTSYIRSKSNVLVPAAVGTALFTILTAKRANLSAPILNYGCKLLGDERFTNIMFNNHLGDLLRKAIENKHVVNAGLSTTGGILAGCAYQSGRYAYKLFSGENHNKKIRDQRMAYLASLKKK